MSIISMKSIGVVILFLFLFLGSRVGSVAQSKPRILIITGNGTSTEDHYPPWIHEFQNDYIVSILKENMDVDVDVSEDLALLERNALSKYQLIISNSIFLMPGRKQLDAVNEFVSGGKPFMTLHAGILSFLNWDRYSEFAGGLFIGGPSSEPPQFRVYTRNTELWGYEYPFRDQRQHPVADLVGDFVTRDELYYFQPNTDDFHVIARAENHPVMWWHPFGQGKVMSLTLGHDLAAKSTRGYQELLANGVRWLLGLPLVKFEPQSIHTIATRQLRYEGIIQVKPVGNEIKGPAVTFEVKNDNKNLFTVSGDGKGKFNMELTGKIGEGRFAILVRQGPNLVGRKDYVVKIVEDGTGDILAYYGNSIEVSSRENNTEVFLGSNLADADSSTRWASASAETASVILDLKKSYQLSKVTLRWEAAYATHYTISVSGDGKMWSQVAEVKNGDGGDDVVLLDQVKGQFVKVEGIQRAEGKWNYSLYDIHIYH